MYVIVALIYHEDVALVQINFEGHYLVQGLSRLILCSGSRILRIPVITVAELPMVTFGGAFFRFFRCVFLKCFFVRFSEKMWQTVPSRGLQK